MRIWFLHREKKTCIQARSAARLWVLSWSSTTDKNQTQLQEYAISDVHYTYLAAVQEPKAEEQIQDTSSPCCQESKSPREWRVGDQAQLFITEHFSGIRSEEIVKCTSKNNFHCGKQTRSAKIYQNVYCPYVKLVSWTAVVRGQAWANIKHVENMWKV